MFALRRLTASLLLATVCISFAAAQENYRQEQAIAAFDDGIVHLLNGKAKRAIKSLEDAVRLDESFLPARRMLGTAYELTGDYAEAISNYVYVIRADSVYSRLLYYQTGDAYYKAGKPAVALKYFRKFQALQERELGNYGLVGEEEAAREKEIVEKELPRRIVAARITQDSSTFINSTEIYNLGAPINTIQNDYFPFFANDLSNLLYTRQGGGGDEDLIRGRMRATGNFEVTRFSSFNTSQPEGMCTLVRDGETIFFTLCHESTSQGGCDIYSGLLINGRIQDVQPLPSYVNSSTWDSQAAISCDGRQLYFASTRPGGVGGSDIYMCERLDDGSWSEPKNLGVNVNTPEDEEAPFLSNDGKALYFSSMGHYSLGDQDIFRSVWSEADQRWSAAINLGPPVNSPHRELGFHLSADGKVAFFSSNRPGGVGGLDIYGLRLNENLADEPVTYVSGYVLDSITGDPVINQEVPAEGLGVFRTNYAGRFFICAPSERPLPLAVTNPDYLPYDRAFAVPAWENRTPYRIDLLLQPEKQLVAKSPEPPAYDTIRRKVRTVVRNLTVLFNFEESKLTLTQIENIEKFVELIKDKNIVRITINGYTDEVGTNSFNLRLSQERADAVGRYLTNLGLKANEIRMRGFGEITGSGSRELKRKVEVEVRIKELVEIN